MQLVFFKEFLLGLENDIIFLCILKRRLLALLKNSLLAYTAVGTCMKKHTK